VLDVVEIPRPAGLLLHRDERGQGDESHLQRRRQLALEGARVLALEVERLGHEHADAGFAMKIAEEI